MDPRKAIAIALYGLAVIGSGMARYFGAEGGQTGLIFGLVMGAISLLAAACFYSGRKLIASSLAWLSIVFVGGWFIYEALIKKGFAESETRQLVVIGLSVVTAIIMLTPSVTTSKKKTTPKGAKLK